MDKFAMVSLVAASQDAGLVRGAIDDLVARAEHQFPGEEAPSAADVASFVTSTREAKPHWWTAAPVPRPQASPILPIHEGLSATEKLARYRPQGVKRERPQPVALSSEQRATLDKLSATQRLTAYRKLQAEQA